MPFSLGRALSQFTHHSTSNPAHIKMAAAALSPNHPNVRLVPRLSQDRGHADHGWLKTFHTFSFAMYYDPRFEGFGSLRVINEDRVEPTQGFGTHPHREMEIFSYIVSGELEHKDSMGNTEIMKRGDVQMTSAGTGIRHSEYNRHKEKEVHFLQIWLLPNQSRLKPSYYTRHFTDAEKRDTLLKVVAPVGAKDVTNEREGSGPTPVHAQLSVYATILSPGKSVVHTFPAPAEGQKARKAYIHNIQTSGYNPKAANGANVQLNGGLKLHEGDGSFAASTEGEKIEITNTGTTDAEVLVFDLE
ncbi:pirin domain-containing protein [Ceratobasidium sp. AG-Ba]|nr:pirin domain-containing protein [Ceratobasidium sp. AG-Ba]QRV88885.1 pirin domain-containing protein [Ceratobasidium sp. AG-Ba]QRW03057.1 pirin domain-containing protein [Ceratobasidium sp. AG-Ba]